MTTDKVFLLSNMRTGSTWLINMLQVILGHTSFGPCQSGELDDVAPLFRERIDAGLIQKQHTHLHGEVFEKLVPNDYTIVTIVRNPRDILTSHAFMVQPRLEAYEPSIIQQRIKERLDDNWAPSMAKQLKRMEPGYSTRNKVQNGMPYIWTSYEWLKEDPAGELIAILDCIGMPYDSSNVIDVAEDFQTRLPRHHPGNHRKGIVGDWINYFDVELLETTRGWQEEYWRLLLTENAAI